MTVIIAWFLLRDRADKDAAEFDDWGATLVGFVLVLVLLPLALPYVVWCAARDGGYGPWTAASLSAWAVAFCVALAVVEGLWTALAVAWTLTAIAVVVVAVLAELRVRRAASS